MLENKYNYKEAEKRWQDFWQEKGVYKFNKEDKVKPIYSIDTPPPTVSGKIHIGHNFSYSQAEFVARYKRMSCSHPKGCSAFLLNLTIYGSPS